MKNFINRQKLRRALIIFSFLLLPATFAYISCPIIIEGASKGIASGGLMVFVWKYLISPLGGVFGIYELLPAFLFSLAACVVVSLATPAPGADIEAEFEAAK